MIGRQRHHGPGRGFVSLAFVTVACLMFQDDVKGNKDGDAEPTEGCNLAVAINLVSEFAEVHGRGRPLVPFQISDLRFEMETSGGCLNG